MSNSIFGRSSSSGCPEVSGSKKRKRAELSNGTTSSASPQDSDAKRRREEARQPTDQESPPSASRGVKLNQLNDHVYELFNSSGRPSIEIVFFHGLQLEGSEKVDITTWISRDGSFWPKWIIDSYPEARILLTSYDSAVKLTDDQGLRDMYNTRENLFQDLTGDASVGQDGCPVILVGHCLGGLVLKQVCVLANSIVGLRSHKAAQNLLHNIKGLFFYGSPHHGSELADTCTRVSKGRLFQDLSPLNTVSSRRNEEFRHLRRKFGWKAFGIGEGLPVSMEGFTGLVVGEASARHDVDSFYTVQGDHFNICRPASTTSSSFSMLSKFIADILKEEEARVGQKVDLAEEVVGLEEPVKKLVERLKGEARLGIVGMGGLGKTTLAKALFNFISENFDYTCFMEDVKTKVESKVDPMELRRKITNYLYYKGKKVNQEVFSWSDLQRKRVLIVLDDVESASQFSVMTVHDGFANESRIIVTSRDKRLLEENDIENCHFHEVLDYEYSRKFFCKHAFRTAVVPSGYEERVGKFVKKCGGIPLALRVGGKYLYGRQDVKLWYDVVKKMSNAESLSGNKIDVLWSIVEVTYDSLAESEQQMFLDIATCFYGEPLEDVKQAWRVCSWASADSGWVNLEDKGLVATSDLYSNYRGWINSIQMHELLRDWGRKTAGRTRVYHDLSKGSWSFHEMNAEVKVVKIVGDLGHVVRRGLVHACRESRLFFFEGCSEYSSERRELRLGLFGQNLHQLRESSTLLITQSSQSGIFFSSFFQNLRESSDSKPLCLLKLRDWHEVEQLPESFGQLTALNHLEIMGCHALRSLPQDFGELEALSHLELTDAPKLEQLPESFGQLTALNHLEIRNCGSLRSLPDGFGELKALSHLDLHDLDKLEQLPESFGQLTALNHLEITCCHALRSLPQDFGELEALSHLELRDAPKLDQLPESFGQLTALNHLGIRSCGSLRSLPDGFGELKALSHLELLDLYELQQLPESFGQLTALNHLKITDRGSLLSLPEGFGELEALSHLKLRQLDGLEQLAESFGQLTALNHLEIRDCGILQSLPEGFGELEALSHLELRDLYNLEQLPESFGQLTALNHLEIRDCGSLRSLPDGFGELKALSHLELHDLYNLEQLTESFGQLTALNHLEIRDCCNLGSLPDGFGELKALSHLELQGLYNLQQLPESFGQLTALNHLEIRDCCNLGSLPDDFGELKALSHLELQGLYELEQLSESFGQLTALNHLEIRDCGILQSLPEGFGELEALSHLELRDLYNLEQLSESFGQLTALNHLKIRDCGSLRILPEGFGQLRALNRLSIRRCGELKTLPESVHQLVSLRVLTLPTKLKMAAEAFCQRVRQIAEFSDDLDEPDSGEEFSESKDESDSDSGEEMN